MRNIITLSRPQLKTKDQESELIEVLEKSKITARPKKAVVAIGAVAKVNTTPHAFQSDDAPMCHNCGSCMIRNGSCYKCLDCGETSGCS